VPHEHDANVGDRFHEGFYAARAADVLQVLALQAAGRVKQDVLSGLQPSAISCSALSVAIAGGCAAAFQVRQDAGTVEQAMYRRRSG